MYRSKKCLSIGLLLCLVVTSVPLYSQNTENHGTNNSSSGATNSSDAKTTPANSPPAYYYTNRQGQRVQSPTKTKTVPPGATAQCRDNSYSFSRNHRGTCSHHGGVAKWI